MSAPKQTGRLTESGASFADRHIGPSADEQAKMLALVGYGSLDELIAAAVPEAIRTGHPLRLPAAASESEVLAELRALAAANQPMTSMIGMGYHDTVTPPVIRRNILENPAFYTAYTPYQPEISQGRLEALLTFQTMIQDLTGLPVAGASMLDEATAAAEAMTICRRVDKSSQAAFIVDADVHPQTLAVLRTRAEPLGIDLEVRPLTVPAGGEDQDGDGAESLPDRNICGILVQYPGSSGAVRDHAALIEAAHEREALVVMAADPLALTLLRPPGEMGADIAVGSAQRFGVPMGYGGPHAGYLAVRSGLQRQLPGRLVGVSVDVDGTPAYRLALQTREQHIRREKATSNICTAQVLLAVMAAAYAVYHGPDGLEAIARRVQRCAAVLAAGLRELGVAVDGEGFFDAVRARVSGRADAVLAAAADRGVNLRRVDADTVSISCDEATSTDHLVAVWAAFGTVLDAAVELGSGDAERLDAAVGDGLPDSLHRESAFLTHPVFHRHRSETAMLRWLRELADRDLALDRTMIPLGSCTMKLNATAEMEPISFPGFARLHPYAPAAQTTGYAALVRDLVDWLAELTGYDAVSLQPNAGSQGELAGLLAVRRYHVARGQGDRDVCLIPSSAHGTNAASAVLAGLRVVVVATDDGGNIDPDDLARKCAEHRDRLAAIMITYPSTHGVFEEGIGEVCRLVHDTGGQVYVDGANLNALVGICRLGEVGADVSHLNLHKTFCIPHGGGGPGVGPVAAKAHLAPYLPGNPVSAPADGPVAAAPYGSAGILPISWAYLRLLGPDGLTRASEMAILAANYVAQRLEPHFPVLYAGREGLVAHECIVDLRPLTKSTGITAEDVAKRLIDFGFHAPTMSFPVAGTLMIEPTESEDLPELDRFCDAMLAIRAEIDQVATGDADAEDNPLKNAPHTAAMLAGEWEHPYSRQAAIFPPGVNPRGKYFPPVRRIDQAYGDRHLVCGCPPVSAFDSG
jgi:glycine dehydrogenase